MFGKSIRIATIFGISIEIDLSWFIIFFLVAWSLSMGYFPYYYPELAKAYYWTMGIVASLLLFFSVLLHELSHSYVALRNHLPISRITLFIFGGVANMAEEAKTPGVEFRVALAGPLCSFFLMALFYLLAAAVEEGSGVYAVFSYASLINGVLALFNLIPGFPLDGGRLLRSAMWHFTGNFRKSTQLASNMGRGFAFFLMALGFLNIMSGNTFNGLWLILIGFFLQNAAEGSYRQVVMKEMLAKMTVEKVMNRRIVSVSGDITLAQLVHDFFIPYHFDSFPVVEGHRVVGIITMAATKAVSRDEWETIRVRDVMDRDLERYLVHPFDPLNDVLNRMVRHRTGWLVVTIENQVIAGIVTRSDIIHLLEVKRDLGE